MKKSILFILFFLMFCFCSGNNNINNDYYYSNFSLFKEGLASVKMFNIKNKCSNYGFIDKTGKVVIEPQFEKVYNFSEGLAEVFIKKISESKTLYKSAYIDKTGKIIIDNDFLEGLDFFNTYGYFESSSFSEGLVSIRRFNAENRLSKYGFIDKTGKIVIEPKFEKVYNFSEGLAAVEINKKWGYIDKTGKIFIEPKFDEVKSFSERLAAVEINKKWGYIDKTGKIFIEPKFDRVESFSEGMAVVMNRISKIDLLYGYIDKTGKIVIDIRFKEAKSFKEGLARVKDKEKYGFINKIGEMVIEPQFNAALDFSEGFACVTKGSQGFFFINKKGNNAFNSFFPSISFFREGLAPVPIDWEYEEENKKDFRINQCGYIDTTGKVVIAFPPYTKS